MSQIPREPAQLAVRRPSGRWAGVVGAVSALGVLGAALFASGAVAQDRSLVSQPTQTRSTQLPAVTPYVTPMPVADEAARRFLAERPGEIVYCSIMLVVNEFGQLDNAFGVGCPNALRGSAIAAVQEWKFYPPTLGDRAVTGRHQVEFAFVSHSVESPAPFEGDAMLVRVSPTAVPEWPSPPKLSGKARRWLEAPTEVCEPSTGTPKVPEGEPICTTPGGGEALDGYRCLLDIEVDEAGLLDSVLVVDCPGPLHQGVLRRLKRFGFQVEGAEPGDGTVYRLDMWLSAD